MCFFCGGRRPRPTLKELFKMTKKDPIFSKELELPSGRTGIIKSNKNISQKELDDISYLFDQEMYQTDARLETVQEKMNEKFTFLFKIHKNDSGYEIVVVIL